MIKKSKMIVLGGAALAVLSFSQVAGATHECPNGYQCMYSVGKADDSPLQNPYLCVKEVRNCILSRTHTYLPIQTELKGYEKISCGSSKKPLQVFLNCGEKTGKKAERQADVPADKA